MPILHYFGLAYFTSAFFVSKVSLLRLYAKPPHSSYTLIYNSLGWVRICSALRLGLAFWAFASIPGWTLQVIEPAWPAEHEHEP